MVEPPPAPVRRLRRRWALWSHLPPGRTLIGLGLVLVVGLTALVAMPLDGPPDARTVLSSLLIIVVLVGVVAACFERLRPGFWRRPRAVALVVLLILSCTLGARVFVPGHMLLAYVYPAAAVAMTLTVLLGLEMGILAAMVLAVVMGLLPTAGASLALLVFLSSLAGAVPLARVERLSTFITAGATLGVVMFTVVLALELPRPGFDARALVEIAGAAGANAMLSTGLAVLGVMVAGTLFGVTTSLQLLDLARPDHPLLRDLQQRAPGTWQHSMHLSSLAEAAAQAIGEDVLLLRVGAYYHDVGKLVHPELFVENQTSETSPHDDLTPEESARFLIGHVTEGAALAAAHGLPESVIDLIWQHHGTTKLVFFYRKAVAQADGAEVDDRPYRYPGPRPQNRAAAVLMLADASEAAVRAAKPTSEADIRAALAPVFRQRLESGELDDSDVTLRDLRRIREAFAVNLKSMHHPRVQYPAESHTTVLEAVPPRVNE